MTAFLKNYDFMDLLKNYNYVPEADHDEPSIWDDFEKKFDRLVEVISINTSEYDFLDLLKDKGYSELVQDHVRCVSSDASNDNEIFIQVAS